MAEQKTGYVYILTNPCFKTDYIKIGMTVNLKERLKQLDNTSTPLPFEVYATLESSRYKDVEKLMHHIITAISADKRVRDKREFYELSPKTAAKMLEEIGTLLDDAHFTLCDEAETEKGSKSDNGKTNRRPPFRFSMVGIKEGEEVTFVDSKPNITVKVADDRHIEYEGELYTMSNFTAAYIPDEKKTASMAFCGPEHFTYKGQFLSDMRNSKDGIE